ncbi:MAG: B12-binding domain-containing radical SAM protein [Desulfobacterales bacterium]|nr:MAG: B12-binding domain-containing radical SAM protein [Desulfobacterales bacterium]
MWATSVIYFLRKFYGVRKIIKYMGLDLENFFSIYPMNIPPIAIQPNLDFLILELPPRYEPFVPNGLGYVYNILKDTNTRFQIVDVNIIIYHRYHSKRVLENINPFTTPDGYVMPKDPWTPNTVQEWEKPEVLKYFMSQMEEVIQAICDKSPKAIGISVHGSNRALSKLFVKTIRERMPDIAIVVGGYDCVYREIGPKIFPDFDYMLIGETEMTLGPFIKKLAKGKKPKGLAGVVSRFDSPQRTWSEPPLLENLDSAGFPRYEWTDLELYMNYAGNRIMPITATRGCKWGKCRFCAECFSFRKRSPHNVVDEIEYFTRQGIYSFAFNESDVNGEPQLLSDICSEIVKRDLKVHLMGQLRIDKKNTKEHFALLEKAGFKYLRFGIDGWTDKILRLQRKGYNMALVLENLRNCKDIGIFSAVNMVVGIPGETEEDVDGMIKNLLHCSAYFDLLSQANTLILAGGSHYYKNPAKHGIRFRGDQKSIYERHPYYIPTDLWYSQEPYIDQEIRIRRMDRILKELDKHKVAIGEAALDVLNNLKTREAEPTQRP